tara:strand:+ start:92 stop:355 length:264 start_codon:yes stop_codon:yes gene_type:complete
MKKKFHIRINYNGYFGQTDVFCKDTKEDIEKSILDKLGQNKVKLEKDGFTRGKWITYEEVIDDTRPIHYETVLGTRMATRAPEVRKA